MHGNFFISRAATQKAPDREMRVIKWCEPRLGFLTPPAWRRRRRKRRRRDSVHLSRRRSYALYSVCQYTASTEEEEEEAATRATH